ncbi:MAG: NERD domain-containing protein/DEAD/DEAH box helicase [Thermomicrobiales bacterium]
MARMYPEKLPPTVESGAERELFAAFRDQLNDRRTVLAGVNWVYTNNRGQGRTAEADFVILDPDRGMLVVEVKGGRVGFDAGAGRWYSISRGGHDNTIKDPVEQARRAFYDLRESLGSVFSTSRFPYPGGHCLAFTDGVVESGVLPIDLPRNIVLDATDMDELDRRIDNIFRFWAGDDHRIPSDSGVEAAVGLLAKSFEIKTPLALDLEREADQMRTLTEQQFRLLDYIGRHPRALISGCAGSGKTFLAAEKARRLAEQGIPTLLTCFNKALAAWLRERLSPYPETLHIQHFHEFAHEFAASAGIDPTKPDDMNLGHYFNVHLPALLMDALAWTDTRYDAIVVDEGQDFQEDWWLALLELLRDPEEGIFYVFFDEQQAIYNREQSLPFDIEPFDLTENLRNTRAIHDFIARFYDDSVRSAGPDGRPPVIVRTDEPETALAQQLGRLIGDGDVSSADIVILTPASEARSIWSTGQRAGRHRITWEDPPPDGEILVSTIHSFKGLERPVVILTEMDGQSYDDHLYLVACSRAKHELIVIEQM